MLIAATDLETTGVVKGSRAVELGCVLYDTEQGEVVDRFESLIYPGMPIPPDVTDLHTITDDMVRDAPDASIVFMNWLAWLPADAVLAIHNAPFDCGIITYDAQRGGVPVPSHLRVIDTLAIARARNGKNGNALGKLVERYGIKVSGDAHRAGHDAEACVKVLMAMHAERPVLELLNPTPWDKAGHEYAYTDVMPTGLEDLPKLVANRESLSFAYVDADENRTERTIQPYGWAVWKEQFYFNGICQLRGGSRREFRADRVNQVFKGII